MTLSLEYDDAHLMTRSVRLRPWQIDALRSWQSSSSTDFLAVATPGSGKTRFALAAVLTQLGGLPGRVIVVTPTSHLKDQWSRAAAAMGLHMVANWRAGQPLPKDVHGLVVTYQQVASSASALARLSQSAVVVLDEVHHAADERAWGDALQICFAGASRRLALSGTPFRSDTAAIPFVRYEESQAVPDVEYGYAQALTDGRVVRPAYFPRQNGRMEWTAPDGSHRTHTFDDRLDAATANQRLRTALSLDGQWLPTILAEADRRLSDLRRYQQSHAGGLVLASDVEHARGIAALLRDRLGRSAVVVTNDDEHASAKITAFGASDTPWIVAVRMISEGVDIPRLRVGVYATTTTTELFFRQAVGRLVRFTPGELDQAAYFYIPDDRRLRTFAATIAEDRRHTLLAAGQHDEEALAPVKRTPVDGQQSLFAAISATPLRGMGETDNGVEPVPTADSTAVALQDEGRAVELAPPPPLGGTVATPGSDPRAEREVLRAGNRDRARAIATISGWPHMKVNAELNRLAGIASVSGATVAALRLRLTQADRWLSRL